LHLLIDCLSLLNQILCFSYNGIENSQAAPLKMSTGIAPSSISSREEKEIPGD
jgi:hypothetical protein